MATTHRNLEVTASDWGLSFESHFFNGSQGIVARYDAPQLRFPADTPQHILRDTVDAWNRRLRETFEGAGYYASCPTVDVAPGEGECLILFASEDFYKDFISSAESESLFQGEHPAISGMR